MTARFLLLSFLVIFLSKTATGQSRPWVVADTAWANQLFQQADPLVEYHYDSAWTMLSQVVGIYESTVGLHSEVAWKALNHLAYIRYLEYNYPAAVALYPRSLAVGRQVLGPRARRLGAAYHNLGVSYYFLGEFEPSLYYLRESLATRLIHLGPLHSRVSDTYNGLGVALHARGDLSGAIENYLKSIEIKKLLVKQDKTIAFHLANEYHNVSVALADQGDTERAIAFIRLGLQTLGEKTTEVKAEALRGLLLLGLAGYFSNQGDHQKSIVFYEKAVTHFQETGLGLSPDVGLCYSNLAFVHGQLYHQEEQHRYLQAALQLWDTLRQQATSIPLVNMNFGAVAFRLLGEAELQSGRLAAAKTHTLESLQLARTFSDPDGLYRAHLQLANIYAQTGPTDSTEYHFAKAMGGPDWSAAREYGSIKSAPGELALFHFDQARTSGDLDALRRAWREWQRFELFLLENRSKLQGHAARTSLLTGVRPLVQTALRAAQHLHKVTGEEIYLRDAFLLAEKVRTLTLFEGLQENNARRFSGIPDSLLARDRNLRLDVAWLEKQIFNLENTLTMGLDSGVLQLSNRLFILKKQADTLQNTFETNYPDYYRLKYDLRVEDVASVQRDLLYPDMALVEYFVGDSTVYIFMIGKNDYTVQEVKKDFPLETWVAQLRLGMTAFYTDPAMAGQYDSLSILYTNAAANIYQKLVAPIAAKLAKKVIIIPDGVLGYVPFEALLVEKPANPTRWNQHHYLLNDHHVSYCYSATMLREMLYRQHKQPPRLNFLGFAPHYDGDTTLLDSIFPYADDMRKGLRPLPHSGEEVHRSAQLMGGQGIVGAAATEARFTELAGQARILHLATHGQANDRAGDYCFLVFAEQADSLENEILYARDIYNLQLNADLVTLSACETGIGELQGGEGLVSLARAFAYAGAKSIVTSLWSVSDAKTKDLMVDFYKNLRKGMLKDDALRQAKLDFLKRNKGQAAHPFYWAGFVGIGNMGKVR